ncbi:MAG TPA: hypothetical protein VFS09_06560 [Candidatus Eisenbacteria bacterium]|nr:hypothetical protein [Candidatus Eisenbacteria bacterium]
MRKILGWTLWVGFAMAAALSTASAQERQEIATGRAEVQSDRQVIVAANLPLTEEQAKAFWPMYREYRGEMEKTGDRLVELILGYAKNAETLTDAQATTMLDDFLAIQKDEVKIRSAWVPKLRKVLPPKAVTRFFQIENKLDAILRFDAAAEIPMVKSDTK